MHTHEVIPTRRRRARWATALAATAIMAVGPAVLVATPAFAAPLSVATPAEGSTAPTAFVDFTGAGTAGNTITITYAGLDEDGAPGTVEAGADVVGPGETYTVSTSFIDLLPGATTVSATVTETAPGPGDGSTGPVVGAPIVRTFNFAVAPNPAIPFQVTSPAAGATVTTATPTFVGTGTPGEIVTIEYTNASGEDSIAGTGTIAVDGSFSIPTTFADLPAGAVEVRTISSAANPDGTPSAQPNVFTSFFFLEAPVPPFVPNTPAVLTIVPETITVSDSKRADRGLQITSTGFGQREELFFSFTFPDGTTTPFVSDTGFFADDTGSYADSLVLFGDVPLGTYTFTITAASGLVLSDTFVVVRDPAPAGTIGGPVLANTGMDDTLAQGLAALAVLLVLAGSAMTFRRRSPAESVTAN